MLFRSMTESFRLMGVPSDFVSSSWGTYILQSPESDMSHGTLPRISNLTFTRRPSFASLFRASLRATPRSTSPSSVRTPRESALASNTALNHPRIVDNLKISSSDKAERIIQFAFDYVLLPQCILSWSPRSSLFLSSMDQVSLLPQGDGRRFQWLSHPRNPRTLSR